MTDEWCRADQIDVFVECDLPAGHEGDHQCMFTWSQTDPVLLAAGSVAIGLGYLEYMRHRYGNGQADD